MYCSVKGESTGGPFFEDESVRFDFEWHSYAPYFLKVKIKNKTDERITVEWENARLLDAPICFKSDNMFSFNNPKPDEVIHAGSVSEKEIGERESPEYRFLIFKESSIKMYGKSTNEIILPIKYPSGKIVDYKIYIYLKYK